MKNIVISIALLGSIFCLGQEKNIINPKNKWYFGAEIGENTISSFQLGESNKSLQIGIFAEYYFAKQWSVSGRIKYFETGVSFFSPNTHSGSWFDLGSDESFGTFNGSVIAIPVDVKWEFRLYKNLVANIKLGYAYNIETTSKFGAYSNNLSTNYPKQYGSFNSGYGLNYFLNQKVALFLDYESYFGTSKGYSEGLFGKSYHKTQNNLINFGMKYNFKK